MFEKVIKTTKTWQQRRTERATLATMDVRMLRDIGLDKFQADRESRKPFWKK